MRCEQVCAELSAFIDGELALDRSQGIADHLAACSGCVDEFQSLRRIVSLTGQVPEDEPPFFLRDRILTAVAVPARSHAQHWLAVAQRLAQSRPMVWAVCGSAAAALAVAMANPLPRQPYTAESARSAAIVSSTAGIAPTHMGHPQPSAGLAQSAIAGGNFTVGAHTVIAAASSKIAAGPATAPVTIGPLAVPALSGEPRPASPSTTEPSPAAVDEQRAVEPPAPVDRGEGLSMLATSSGMASMGRDVTGAETGMAMMLEPKKMAVMTGAGAAAGNDDGLEELRQFLQDTTRSGDDPGKDGKKKPL